MQEVRLFNIEGLRSYGCVQTSHCAQGPEGEIHFSFPHFKLLFMSRVKERLYYLIENVKNQTEYFHFYEFYSSELMK